MPVPDLAVTLLRMLIVAAIVVVAARVAEQARPTVSALIATLPFSVGPSYVLLALDHDSAFLEQAALKSIGGTAATTLFIATFATLLPRLPGFAALGGAFSIWALAAWWLNGLDWSAGPMTLLTLGVLGLSHSVTARLRAAQAAAPQRPRWWDVPLRGTVVALLVGTLTALSHWLGPRATGTLANFPVIMSSMGLLLSLRLGPKPAAAMLASSMGGMTGICLAFVLLHFSIARLGTATALLLALALCILWNLGLYAWARRVVLKKEHFV